MSTPACCSTEALLGKKMCDFLCAHRHLRAAPLKKGTNAHCSHTRDYVRTGGPLMTFRFFFPRDFFFFPIAFVCSTNCDSRLPWEQLFQLCWEQRRKGKGEGCLQGEVRQESAFTIPLTLGQGQTECTFQHKAPSGHKLSPWKVPGSICGGKKKKNGDF